MLSFKNRFSISEKPGPNFSRLNIYPKFLLDFFIRLSIYTVNPVTVNLSGRGFLFTITRIYCIEVSRYNKYLLYRELFIYRQIQSTSTSNHYQLEYINQHFFYFN